MSRTVGLPRRSILEESLGLLGVGGTSGRRVIVYHSDLELLRFELELGWVKRT